LVGILTIKNELKLILIFHAVILGARWRAMSAEDKAPYEEMANADKIRANKEMDIYKSRKAEEGSSSGSDNNNDDNESMDENDD
jgi:hypothetical protein